MVGDIPREANSKIGGSRMLDADADSGNTRCLKILTSCSKC